MDENFKFVEPLDLITNNVNPDHKQEPAREREKEKQHKEKEREEDKEKSDVMVLEGHTSYVRHYCTIGDLIYIFSLMYSILTLQSSLVSKLMLGFFLSGDSTTRIWTIGDGPCNSTIQRSPPNVLVLKHLESQATKKNKDATSLDSNCEDTLLASGVTMAKLKSGKDLWKKKGDYLLNGSIDTIVVVLNLKSGKSKKQFDFCLCVLSQLFFIFYLIFEQG
ncbi:hypothetical protein H5410_051538 [Solanum commersonii]|uniref:Uncharacterized protein n=1 Tax=Solanum commersonii TaxID=4109 RepID=A0A9J5WZT7_SOLCO|nr:hypothetical protein H5410_051538 [Solanum commersonii]